LEAAFPSSTLNFLSHTARPSGALPFRERLAGARVICPKERTMKKRPDLLLVRVRPNEQELGLYELECLYSDGVILSEVWGSKVETQRAAELRRLDIKKSAAPKSNAPRI
jgi:hypothetical protein